MSPEWDMKGTSRASALSTGSATPQAWPRTSPSRTAFFSAGNMRSAATGRSRTSVISAMATPGSPVRV